MSNIDGRNFLLQCVTDIVSSYVSKNKIVAKDLGFLVQTVSNSLIEVEKLRKSPSENRLQPAIAIKRSISPEHIICLEDGKKFKSLKRHLRTEYDLSPNQYREKWQLPHDYPMVAPNYAKKRSEIAKKMKLGRKKKNEH